MAKIYGVTSDEILRGQRSNPDVPVRSIDTVKAEKQRKQLLKSTQTKFHTRSLITGTITILLPITITTIMYTIKKRNSLAP